MALTRIAMFFHLETPLKKEIHEWAGWLMVAGVAPHVTVNWMAFKRYFQALPRGLAIVAVFALITLGSFLVRGGGKGDGAGSPPASCSLGTMPRWRRSRPGTAGRSATRWACWPRAERACAT